MALMSCPECSGKLSDKALACPACGYPLAAPTGGGNWPTVLGRTASAYVSAQALATMIVGSVAIISFAAIMIALIVK